MTWHYTINNILLLQLFRTHSFSSFCKNLTPGICKCDDDMLEELSTPHRLEFIMFVDFKLFVVLTFVELHTTSNTEFLNNKKER